MFVQIMGKRLMFDCVVLGYMELQQGCPDVCCDDLWCGNIRWPES